MIVCVCVCVGGGGGERVAQWVRRQRTDGANVTHCTEKRGPVGQ